MSYAQLPSFYREHADAEVVLLVSSRSTQRVLLFDEEMRLVGWMNTATGEVRTPYSNLEVSRCQQFAFSGIHRISPDLASSLRQYPETFSIMQFYIENCHQFRIVGVVDSALRLLDVGKQESLAVAENFLNTLEE